MITYPFTRVPFGLTRSSFLLSATIRELADIYKAEFPTAAALVDNSVFMDDLPVIAENDDCVTKLYYELISLMKQIRLEDRRCRFQRSNTNPWNRLGYRIGYILNGSP